MRKAKGQILKDSGSRQKFHDGAQRDSGAGKGRFDLLPEEATMLVAIVFELGATKYLPRNWERGIPISRYLDSALRHVLKYKAGMRDEPHLSQAAWNILCALQTGIWIERGLLPRRLFDLPNHVSRKKLSPLSQAEVTALWPR